ncbi:acyl-CoA thioesterase [Prescottella agglutinans]|uniref:Acyl-CoA thioester hydrolase n=1 Tax=Prescottella agglutinans TaxID=1644129 RepID=A0ABT6MIZ1_9NOCA|nr:thioesterase family protein [Prescottella agglutinans]MDH6284265.1 acyl-CoA thioester hydrolase [Prescottella agglutinans]
MTVTPTTAVNTYTSRVVVRWSDMDIFKHVNHARMVTLLEEARIDWLFSAGPEIANLLEASVVAGVELRYRTPLKHSDSPLAVTMWIEKLRSVDVTIRYEVRSAHAEPDSKPAVTATTQLAFANPEAGTLRRLSADERAVLAPWTAEG